VIDSVKWMNLCWESSRKLVAKSQGRPRSIATFNLCQSDYSVGVLSPVHTGD